MSKTPQTVVLHESVIGSIISDTFTFLITAILVLLADGRSTAWQVITVAIFIFWSMARTGLLGKVHKFYRKQDLVEWANALPDDDEGGAA